MTRDDATHLSLSDRIYLVYEGIEMIEEGLSAVLMEAVDEGVEPDDPDLHDNLNDLRTSSYVSLLHTMTTDEDDRKSLVRLMRQYQEENLD